MSNILLVDDDQQLLKLLRLGLQRRGFEVLLRGSGEEALRTTYQDQPDLVVTDLHMPGMDGLELCKRLREICDIPIIVLSALNTEQTIVEALEAGADDYITKPYNITELAARIQAKLQACSRTPHARKVQATLEVGDLHIDTLRRQVTVRGEAVTLTGIEYELLLCLARHRNEVVDHRKLLSDTWGPECGDQLEYLRIYVHSLRRKVETNPAKPRMIKSMRGVGYYLAA